MGWRKVDANSRSIMVRLSDVARVWLKAEATAAGMTESEIVRQLIEQRMAQSRVSRKEQGTMRGVAQVGHDAVVVWSPTHDTHVEDLNAQLARGCHERPRGSFQQSPTGMFFSWLDAPEDYCELCGGPCRVVRRRRRGVRPQ